MTRAEMCEAMMNKIRQFYNKEWKKAFLNDDWNGFRREMNKFRYYLNIDIEKWNDNRGFKEMPIDTIDEDELDFICAHI